jgi:hypothetical protein
MADTGQACTSCFQQGAGTSPSQGNNIMNGCRFVRCNVALDRPGPPPCLAIDVLRRSRSPMSFGESKQEGVAGGAIGCGAQKEKVHGHVSVLPQGRICVNGNFCVLTLDEILRAPSFTYGPVALADAACQAAEICWRSADDRFSALCRSQGTPDIDGTRPYP